MTDNTSYFLAADFDGGSWEKDVEAFINAAKSAGLFTCCERSRSGKGGHAWIFFSQPYPCWKSRRIGLELVRKALNISEFEKVVSFDRLFPSQDYLSQEGFGNLIALPLQGKSILSGNSAFFDLDNNTPYADQCEFLAQGKYEIILISGDDSSAKRVIKLKQIESGHYQVVLSTGQFFGEGLDIHGITCLILAFPFSFEGKLAQYIGRMRDIGEQKFLIDYRDSHIPFLERQFKQRQHFCKKMSFKITTETSQRQMF